MCVSRSRVCRGREAADFVRVRMKVVVFSPLRLLFLPLAIGDGGAAERILLLQDAPGQYLFLVCPVRLWWVHPSVSSFPAAKVSTTTRLLGCSGEGAAVDRYVDLATLCSGFGRRAQIQGRDGVGCVPGRCSCSVFVFPSMADIFCGSLLSLGAMALVSVCGGRLPSRASSGDFGGGGIWRWAAVLENAEASKDFFAFLLLVSRGFCVVGLFPLYPLLCSPMYAYLYGLLAS